MLDHASHVDNLDLAVSFPGRPWSHMVVDFITDLPSFSGFNTILVAINQFFKVCHLVPLRAFQQLWKLQQCCLRLPSSIQRPD